MNAAAALTAEVLTYCDEAGNPHLDPHCPEIQGAIVPFRGFAYGWPCTCCDEVVQSAYGVGTGVAARLAGNVPGSTYSLPSGGDGTGHGSTTSGPSEKQVRFYTRLVNERLPEADREAWLTSPAIRSKSAISKRIDALLDKPVISTNAPQAGRTNRYSGECATCHGTVAPEQGIISKVDNRWIVKHVECPSAPARVTNASAPLADVPAGHYAYPSSGRNDLSFVRVDRPTEGRWAGRVFVKQVIGGRPDQPIARQNVPSVLESIVAFGVDLAAQTYGQEVGRCCRCNRHLTDAASRAAGIGPDCASRS